LVGGGGRGVSIFQKTIDPLSMSFPLWANLRFSNYK
jgi:hypothetical protein